MTPLIERLLAQLANEIERAQYHADTEEEKKIDTILAAIEEAAREL